MKLAVAVSALALTACAVDPRDQSDPSDPPTATATSEQRVAPRPRLLAPGTGLLPQEITDDNYAIYQDGTQVLAVSLDGGAPQLIVESPPGNPAFVWRFGKVAFVWTNPNRALPNFGVSPLVIWSAATGAHLASPSSAIGTLATAASPHGDFVIFPSNSAADGSVGDLVYASTDLAHQTTLIANAQMGFAVGPCNPLATFVDRDPVAVYCTTDPATATLSRWSHGTRRDLVPAAFAPPQLAIDPESDRILTLAAGSRNPLLVDRHGTVTALADVSGRIPSFGPDGTIYYATRTTPAPAPAQLVRFQHGAPRQLADIQGVYSSSFQFGARSFTAPLTSSDGRAFLILTEVDPTTGYSNVVRLDARTGEQLTIDPAPNKTQFGPAFTSGSTFALYALGDPTFTTFVGPMFAASCDGTRQFSDDLGWAYLAGRGDTIIYNDNAISNPANALLTTGDLKTVDLDRATLAPRLIAAQANATFFVTSDQQTVLYASDHDARPGLYAARTP